MNEFENIRNQFKSISDSISEVIFGQDDVVQQLLTCLLAGGHVLIEGVPGLGKTLLARVLAKLIDAEYKRIQFTPDLLPSDITGTNVFNLQRGDFQFHHGPVFTDILLADEINRTPPKSQSALLEAMEERQVSVDGTRHRLSDMFFVMATQNPIEYEGTYPLPETQLDRFMMKINITYPPSAAEFSLLKNYAQGIDLQDLDAVVPFHILNKSDLSVFRKALTNVTVQDDVLEYMRHLVDKTRDTMYVQLGGSPRSSVALLKASRAFAAIRGSGFITPDHVKAMALPVLRHRIILRPEALIDGLTPDNFLDNIVSSVPVPR
jgi:MoxR-like ATPase